MSTKTVLELSTPNRLFAIGLSKNQLYDIPYSEADQDPSLLDAILHPHYLYSLYPSDKTFRLPGTAEDDLKARVSEADIEKYFMEDLRTLLNLSEEKHEILRELLLQNPYLLYSSKFMRLVALDLKYIKQRCMTACCNISFFANLLYAPAFIVGLLLFYIVSPLLYILIDIPFCRICRQGSEDDVKFRRQVMHDYPKLNSHRIDNEIQDTLEKIIEKARVHFPDFYIYYWNGEDKVNLGSIQGAHVEERFFIAFAEKDSEVGMEGIAKLERRASSRKSSIGHISRSSSRRPSPPQVHLENHDYHDHNHHHDHHHDHHHNDDDHVDYHRSSPPNISSVPSSRRSSISSTSSSLHFQ